MEADFALLELDRIRVVGKALPETIYALIGGSEMRATNEFQEMAAVNAEMLAAYRAQDWPRALDLLQPLQERSDAFGLNLDAYLSYYRDRIETLRDAPPDSDWDGVYVSLKK